MTNEEIREKRKQIFDHSERTTTIHKGDKRVAHATRFCAVCHRPLTRMIKRTGKVICIVDHAHCKLGLLQVNLCKDPRSCYRNLARRPPL